MLCKSVKVLSLVFLMASGFVQCASYARKVTAATGTVLYWGLTLKESIGTLVADYIWDKSTESFERIDKNDPACQTAKDFLKTELTKLGLPDVRVFSGFTSLANDQWRVERPIKNWIDEHLRTHPAPAVRAAKIRKRLVEQE